MIFTQTWPLWLTIATFIGCALVLIVIGLPFARIVDRIADRTGLGEAIAGALLLGATTSMPGLITTVVAAINAEAELAISNAMGGIAAQTLFLALADVFYRRANLEHAAASLPNMLQTTVLISLIALVLLAAFSPPLTVFTIHPVTPLLLIFYLYGLRLTRTTGESPMWQPKPTTETRLDIPDDKAKKEPLANLLISFLTLATLVAGTGFIVARAGLSLMADTGLSGTLVGGLMTSVITSLPELVTVFAAVRVGALTLAVGDIIGGNTFDVLFIAAADIAFQEGSIYHAIGPSTLFILTLTILLTSVLAAGMIHRQERGIGFEGLAILMIYSSGFFIVFLMG